MVAGNEKTEEKESRLGSESDSMLTGTGARGLESRAWGKLKAEK